MIILFKILLIYLYFINTLNTLYFHQQDNYHYRCFKYILNYNIKHQIFTYLVLLIFIVLPNTIILNSIQVILLLIICLIYTIKDLNKILKIKYTNRVKRLIILHFIIILLIQLLIINYTFIFQKIIFIIINIFYISLNILIFSISLFFEMLIMNKYYVSAISKIKKYQPFIIAITGSAGKTSVKNYIYECLKTKYIVYKSPKSYNTLKGLTITINDYLHSYNNYFILEMGLSHQGDIYKSAKIYQPNISIITEILPSHLETMKSIDNIIDEKMQIIKKMKSNGLIIINGDNELITNNIQKYNINNNKIIKIGFNNTNDYYVKNYKIKKTGLDLEIFDNKNNKYIINSKLNGRHNIYNLLIVFALLEHFHFPISQIISLLSMQTNYENRLEVINNGQLTILNDSYNSNINGFINALELLSLYDGRKYIITPGIVESGKENQHIINLISEKIIKTCDYCYLINNQSTQLFIDYFEKNNYKTYGIKHHFQEAYNEIKDQNITVLIENDLTDFYYMKGENI